MSARGGMSARKKRSETQPLRKVPTQERSRERLERIISAAATLMDEQGYEAVSTNAIAAKAGIPIGSLYQYFPDKRSILRAMAERCRDGSLQVFDQLAEAGALAAPLETLVNQVVTAFADFHETIPGFRTVMMAWHTPELRDEHRALHDEFERRTSLVISARIPNISATQCATVAAVVVNGMDALMNVAMLRPRAARKLLFEEIKVLMLRYLAPYESR